MRVLIVRLSAIGDVIQGIPCLVALKSTYPDWEISWLVEETSAPILEGHPCLKKLYVVPTQWRKNRGRLGAKWKGIKSVFKIACELRREKFDAVIDLQGLFKSGFWSWITKAPRRIGFKNTREFADRFLNEHVSSKPVFDPNYPLHDRYLEPAKYLGADLNKAAYSLPPTTREVIHQVDKLFTVSNGKPKIALCPWSNWETKNWPLDRWIELGRSLSKDYDILLIGSQADRVYARNMESNIPGSLNLVGRTNLQALAEVFRRCEVVLGPDSGPVHLANAVNHPRVVMIFGSTSWRRSGPVGAQHKTISLDLNCQPCFERLCPLGHLNCLKRLDVATVNKAVLELTSR